jgi:adenylate kinase
MEKMLNLVLFGPPGAGKGTQSENLINKYGLIHLSTGDILRTEIALGTNLGIKAKEVIDRGELVSDDIVIDMIEAKLDASSNAKGFIFDGFPRTEKQAEALDDLLQKKGTGVSAMIALEVEGEELIKRLLNRGKDSGRPDDSNEEVIRKRIEEYNAKTLPLKNYYNQQGKFHSIKGIGTIDEIFKYLVDRIVFLKAEIELTELESDLEHLDLTIQDYEEANDIAPELILEIDAIKRAEAEEVAEAKKLKKANTIPKNKAPQKKVVTKKLIKKSAPTKKAPAKPSRKVVTKKVKTNIQKKAAPKKATLKKVIAKKVVAKIAVKKIAKKVIKKIATKKKVVAKKIAKKILKKAIKKPIKKAIAKKVIAKKIAPKKLIKKVSRPVAIKKTSKKKK